MTETVACGAVLGRFQILHNDHLAYIMAARKHCGHLVIGITNPDPRLARPEQGDGGRTDPRANPLTYYERQVMVRGVLEAEGVPLRDFSPVPFPVSFPELYRYYVPAEAVFYITVYDEWGRMKRGHLQSQGFHTRVLWERPIEHKGISGTDVRERIRSGKPWEHLVPRAAADLVRRWNIADRLSQMNDQPSCV